MAEDPNLNKKDLSDVRDITKDIASELKNILRSEGDYNNLVRDSLRDLSKSLTEYDRIVVRLEQLSSMHLNINAIQKKQLEIQYKSSSAQRDFMRAYNNLSETQRKNVDSYNKLIATRQQQEADLQKAIIDNNKDAQTLAIDALKISDQQLNTYRSTLNVEEQQAIALEARAKLYTKAEKSSLEILNNEKEVHKSIGLTGRALEVLAKKLGVGDQVYQSMVTRARQLQAANQAAAGGKGGGGGIGFFQSFSVAGAGAKGLASAIWNGTAGWEKFLGITGLIVAGYKKVLDLILELNDRVTKFGRTLGISREESAKMVGHFGQISTHNNNLLITTKSLMEAQTALSEQLGITNQFSDDILQSNIELNKILGLTAEEQAGIASASIITSTNQQKIVDSVLGQFAALKKLSGVGFNYKQVLQETSKLGGFLGLQFAKYPTELAKSLAVIKALGQDINKLNDQASSLLDFESSIQNEIEAQLLTGRRISLAKARELALNNDLAGLATEITRQYGSASQFLKENRVQQESLAKSAGMTRDEFAKVLKQQELLNKLGVRAGASADDQLKAATELYKTKQGIVDALGKEAYQNLTNLSIQEKIAGLLDKVKDAFQTYIINTGILDKIQTLVDDLTDPNKNNIQLFIQGAMKVANIIYQAFAGITVALLHIGEVIATGSADKALKNLRYGIESTLGKDLLSLDVRPPALASGGVVTKSGFAQVDRGEVYLGSDSLNVIKQQLEETREQNRILKQLLAKDTVLQLDGQPIAVAVARHTTLSPASQADNMWR